MAEAPAATRYSEETRRLIDRLGAGETAQRLRTRLVDTVVSAWEGGRDKDALAHFRDFVELSIGSLLEREEMKKALGEARIADARARMKRDLPSVIERLREAGAIPHNVAGILHSLRATANPAHHALDPTAADDAVVVEEHTLMTMVNNVLFIENWRFRLDHPDESIFVEAKRSTRGEVALRLFITALLAFAVFQTLASHRVLNLRECLSTGDYYWLPDGEAKPFWNSAPGYNGLPFAAVIGWAFIWLMFELDRNHLGRLRFWSKGASRTAASAGSVAGKRPGWIALFLLGARLRFRVGLLRVVHLPARRGLLVVHERAVEPALHRRRVPALTVAANHHRCVRVRVPRRTWCCGGR